MRIVLSTWLVFLAAFCAAMENHQPDLSFLKNKNSYDQLANFSPALWRLKEQCRKELSKILPNKTTEVSVFITNNPEADTNKSLLFTKHGTFGTNDPGFFDPNNPLFKEFIRFVIEHGGNFDIVSARWDGKNKSDSRIEAGKSDAVLIKELNSRYKKKFAAGYSHGENSLHALLYSLPKEIIFDAIFAFGSPVRDHKIPDYQPSHLGVMFNGSSIGDLIQFIGRFKGITPNEECDITLNSRQRSLYSKLCKKLPTQLASLEDPLCQNKETLLNKVYKNLYRFTKLAKIFTTWRVYKQQPGSLIFNTDFRYDNTHPGHRELLENAAPVLSKLHNYMNGVKRAFGQCEKTQQAEILKHFDSELITCYCNRNTKNPPILDICFPTSLDKFLSAYKSFVPLVNDSRKAKERFEQEYNESIEAKKSVLYMLALMILKACK